MSISTKDQKLLWARSGNKCAYPGCGRLLTEGEGTSSLVVGEMAHICGEKRGAARWDQKVLAHELNSYDNLILMCPTHHTMIDKDERTYTVEVLKKHKEQHERDRAEPAFNMTEFEGQVSVKAKDGDSVTGARIIKLTRIKSGTSITVETENVKNVMGVHIGGE